jgi:hypothetical protein
MKRVDSSRWDSFWVEFEALRTSISRIQAVNVNKREIRESAKEIVRYYFSEVRPKLRGLGIDTAALDESMQNLVRLSNGVNARKSYQRVLKSIDKERATIEMQRAIRMGEVQASLKKYQPNTIETAILSTLEKLLPVAAIGYRQALEDLSDPGRLSFRGTAAELREVLREVLDHMAPDEIVMAAEGFQLEKGSSSPTMKQKMHFILHSRKSPKTTMKAPEDATSLVDNWRASFARSAYERASVSAHRLANRQEVIQLKMYVDSALAEILIIPT